MRQVGEWLTQYHREPWGYDAIDTRNALLALVTAQAAGAKNLKLENFRIRTPAGQAEAEAAHEEQLVQRVRDLFGPRAPIEEEVARGQAG